MDILTEPLAILVLLGLAVLAASIAWASGELAQHGDMRRAKGVLLMFLTWPIGPLVCLVLALRRGRRASRRGSAKHTGRR